MSKIIYVCVRDPLLAPATAQAVAAVAGRLVPDNLDTVTPQVIESGGIVVGISTPNELLGIRGTSIAAGYLVEPGQWERPRSGRPDGAYALFRSDDAVVEIVTDALASRTVWYVLTDSMFIASTSQRAIVALLGSFELNREAIPWMLAAGTLGPGQSWDRRIRFVPGATCVLLDRESWTLKEHSEELPWTPVPASNAEHERRMILALKHAVGAAHVADTKWAIALSGGVDCRTILCLLDDTTGLRAVTWGLRKSLQDRTNDAYIARRLARHFGLDHQYFETDLAQEPMDRVLERFVANGEGRIDNVSAYLDGFSLWSRLVQAGVRGIVRGDEAFGRQAVRTPAEVRAYLPQWSDFRGLPPLESFGIPSQTVPDQFLQQPGESLATWRDRIQHSYRVPCILGALSDLKFSYVELINPLLSDSLVELFRSVPDLLRTNKKLLRRIGRSLSPNISFATSRAIQTGLDSLGSPRVVELLRDTLAGNGAGSAIPREFADYVLDGMDAMPAARRPTIARRLRQSAGALAPSWVKELQTSTTPVPVPNSNRMAFRAYVIERTTHLLQQDAALLSCR